ncbi:hypothetical protein G7Y89_g11698 [Cudoniella acicularis]|uniref:Uncharacterized protein n=1 Tax=Cudoniella acicularis TaxID=354080 RepID=A0A8H4W0E0_9HELO|nr:hypothetical protein G7Y89_g11698 [Cudoniella acicularis]
MAPTRPSQKKVGKKEAAVVAALAQEAKVLYKKRRYRDQKKDKVENLASNVKEWMEKKEEFLRMMKELDEKIEGAQKAIENEGRSSNELFTLYDFKLYDLEK